MSQSSQRSIIDIIMCLSRESLKL